ncbi:MAG: DUF2726 domain-containing protein [Candidatus Magasanikbacteria bacterium]
MIFFNFLLLIVVMALFAGGIAYIKKKFFEYPPTEDLPYRLKDDFFYQTEYKFFKILKREINDEGFIIFPKVRLADFIEVENREGYKWWNKIKSKHVDFLIWDSNRDKIALAIELDGSSHENKNREERGDFVDNLYDEIELDLQRIKVGSDFKKKIEEIKKYL